MELNDKNSIFQGEYRLLEKADKVQKSQGFDENPIKKEFTELMVGYKKLLQQSVRIVSISDKQQNFLYKLQSDLKNILDSTQQGIFTVNEDLTVNRGCSAECERIFRQNIEGCSLIELLIPYNDKEKIELVSSILNKDFFSEDPLNKKVLLLLLPEEFNIGQSIYSVRYNPLSFDFKDEVENAFMIVLTDITEKKAIQKKMEDEKAIFKSVTRIISDIKSFSVCVRDYKSFYTSRLSEILNSVQMDTYDMLNEIFREVHTLKGNFSIFELPWIVDFLNDVEKSMVVMREHCAKVSISEVKRMISSFDFENILNESLNSLRSIIGSKWILDREFSIIDTQALKDVESQALVKAAELAEVIRKLRYTPITELLSIYPDYVQRMSERMGKSVSPFKIEISEDISVDAEKYDAFVRCLVHVFRNMVDHGIETHEERAALGKDLDGRIRCCIEKDNDYISISISDDGRGVDLEAVKQSAAATGKLLRQQEYETNEEDELNLIFVDGVSTKADAGGISGRGVGLSAVKEQTELIGGNVKVISKPGHGTEFVFKVPYGL